MRWQLSRVDGALGACSIPEALAGAPVRVNENGQAWVASSAENEGADERDLIWARLEPLLVADLPNWLILPHTETTSRQWWQDRAGAVAEIVFGRACIPLALGQMARLGVPGRLIAVHRPPAGKPGIEALVVLEWTPAEEGMEFEFTCMDGRLDGKTDVGALLLAGQEVVSAPEVMVCPGTDGNDLERLLPFMSQLGGWSGPEVRWEFPEAAIGRLGVAGGLYSLAWLESGYRLGDFSGPAILLELDDSPLAGLAVVSWHASRMPNRLT